MRWMKVDAACSYAGGVSRRTLYDAVRAGKLKAAHVGAGRNILFAESFIDEWLKASAESSNLDKAVQRP
jgi:excisionase family DNA binding protein